MSVSIITPAFNAERTIADTIKSVMAQSYKDWEMIVIDDASLDGTADIVRDFADKDERIKLVTNTDNIGVAASRNKGVLMANTEWIAFLDADDMWTEDKLEKQMKLAEDLGDEAQLLFTGSSFVKDDGTPMDFILHTPEFIEREELVKQNLISCSSVLVRRKLMLKYPMPTGRKMHEDYVSWIRMLGEIPFAHGIDEPLLIYRVGKNSKSGNKAKAALLNLRALSTAGLSMPHVIQSMVNYGIRGLKKWKHLS